MFVLTLTSYMTNADPNLSDSKAIKSQRKRQKVEYRDEIFPTTTVAITICISPSRSTNRVAL